MISLAVLFSPLFQSSDITFARPHVIAAFLIGGFLMAFRVQFQVLIYVLAVCYAVYTDAEFILLTLFLVGHIMFARVVGGARGSGVGV